MSQPLFSVINHDVDYMIRNTHQTRIIMNTKLSYVILIKRVSKGVILIYHFIFSDQEKNDALNIDLYFNIYSFVMKVLKDFFFRKLNKKFFYTTFFCKQICIYAVSSINYFFGTCANLPKSK